MNMKAVAQEILDTSYTLGRALAKRRSTLVQRSVDRHDAAMKRFQAMNPSPLVMERLLHADQINRNLGQYADQKFPVDLFQAANDAEKSLFKVLT